MSNNEPRLLSVTALSLAALALANSPAAFASDKLDATSDTHLYVHHETQGEDMDDDFSMSITDVQELFVRQLTPTLNDYREIFDREPLEEQAALNAKANESSLSFINNKEPKDVAFTAKPYDDVAAQLMIRFDDINDARADSAILKWQDNELHEAVMLGSEYKRVGVNIQPTNDDSLIAVVTFV